MYRGDGVLLTFTKDVMDHWKGRNTLKNSSINPTDTPYSEEAGPGDLGMGSLISGANIAEVVKKHTTLCDG